MKGLTGFLCVELTERFDSDTVRASLTRYVGFHRNNLGEVKRVMLAETMAPPPLAGAVAGSSVFTHSRDPRSFWTHHLEHEHGVLDLGDWCVDSGVPGDTLSIRGLVEAMDEDLIPFAFGEHADVSAMSREDVVRMVRDNPTHGYWALISALRWRIGCAASVLHQALYGANPILRVSHLEVATPAARVWLSPHMQHPEDLDSTPGRGKYKYHIPTGDWWDRLAAHNEEF